MKNVSRQSYSPDKIKMLRSGYRFIFILFFFICKFAANSVFAQNTVSNTDENFVFEVKQIEDFIDRFNLLPDNYFIKYYNSQNPDNKLTRTEMIKSLYDRSSLKKEGLDTLKKFLTYVTNPKQPSYLNFYGGNWYADLDCQFEQKGKPVKIKLVLEIQVDDFTSYACRWVICGVKSDLLSIPEALDSTKFISPASHGTDFLALDKILNDKKGLVNYFYSNFKPSNLTLFVNELRNGNLKFIQVNSVAYDFFQVKGWGIEVKNFPNHTKLSGWLISRLFSIKDEEKDYYIYKNLGVQ